MPIMKTAFGFFKAKIKPIYLFNVLVIVVLISILYQLSEIRTELKTVLLIQKLTHPEKDLQAALLTSEQQDFILMNLKEQIEKWNKMTPAEKPKYAEIFADEVWNAEYESLGLTYDDVLKLVNEAREIAKKSPKGIN